MLDARATARLGRLSRFDQVEWFEELESTNGWLLTRAGAGAPEGLVAIADHQTAGRGRRGRRWEAPTGSALLLSVLLRPAGWTQPLDATDRHLLTAVMALAAADACQDVAGFRPGLKWPNDLHVGHRKLAGILAETAGPAVVVGLGLNMGPASAFPPELGAVTVEEVSGRPVERSLLAEAVLLSLEEGLGALEAGGAPAVVPEWRRCCSTLGRDVRVDLGDRVLEGRAEDLGPGGELLVRVAGRPEPVPVVAGDVVHVRPGTPP